MTASVLKKGPQEDDRPEGGVHRAPTAGDTDSETRNHKVRLAKKDRFAKQPLKTLNHTIPMLLRGDSIYSLWLMWSLSLSRSGEPFLTATKNMSVVKVVMVRGNTKKSHVKSAKESARLWRRLI